MAIPRARTCQCQCVCKIFHTDQQIGRVSFFPNLDFDKASTDDKRHFEIPSVRSCQYQCVFTILSKYSFWFKSYGYWAFFACSQFGPRQSLDHWEMIFCILMGKILSISTGMQNFIKIFHKVQEIWPVSLY